jgi:hypothetical protein
MARFFGVVGYGVAVETPPGSGKWVDVITEKSYYGDVKRVDQNLGSDEKVNEDVSVMNTIEVIADAYASGNFLDIKYVEWAGRLWTVTSVDASRPPRLILSLGRVYNGPTPEV